MAGECTSPASRIATATSLAGVLAALARRRRTAHPGCAGGLRRLRGGAERHGWERPPDATEHPAATAVCSRR
ncbi:MAG: hypothetical protein MZV65_01215 [Chromatiales bacterium]|nr:hypothetical protein [Chromatiales bacterium]